MPETYNPISVRDFMSKYKSQDNLFDVLPEFYFIKNVAQQAKEKGCECGLGEQINKAIMIFNELVPNLDSSIVMKVGNVFGVQKVCFPIQTQTTFSIHCY